MKLSNRYIAGALLIAGSALLLPVHAASDPEARQMTEDFSPQAQSRLATREAQAAYQEAIAACKALKGAERTSCMKEARTNLQADLANAKKLLSSGQ